MNIVVPMAGRGRRFSETGETIPKPLIPVLGQPMLYWALKSLDNVTYSRVIFIALAEHDERYGLKRILYQRFGEKCEVVLIDDVTEGQLCTVLAAKSFIDVPEDLLIVSSDTYVKSQIHKHIEQKSNNCSGIISVANLPGDRWSFARINDSGRVVEVAEKVRISDHASTGMYYFSDGVEFVREAEEMVRKQEKVRGEYYVIPVYQKYIKKGYIIELSHAEDVYDMGTPEALEIARKYLINNNDTK